MHGGPPQQQPPTQQQPPSMQNPAAGNWLASPAMNNANVPGGFPPRMSPAMVAQAQAQQQPTANPGGANPAAGGGAPQPVPTPGADGQFRPPSSQPGPGSMRLPSGMQIPPGAASMAAAAAAAMAQRTAYNAANGGGGAGAGGVANGGYPAPLPRPSFMTTFQRILQQRGIPFDERMCTVADRRIDVWQLHCEVMQAGGYQAVC
jgi:hypothetical protein